MLKRNYKGIRNLKNTKFALSLQQGQKNVNDVTLVSLLMTLSKTTDNSNVININFDNAFDIKLSRKPVLVLTCGIRNSTILIPKSNSRLLSRLSLSLTQSLIFVRLINRVPGMFYTTDIVYATFGDKCSTKSFQKQIFCRLSDCSVSPENIWTNKKFVSF